MKLLITQSYFLIVSDSYTTYVESEYGGIPTGEGILKYAFLWTTQYIVLLCMNDRKC